MCVCVCFPPALIPFHSILVTMQGNRQTTQAVKLEDVFWCDTGSVTELVSIQCGNAYSVTLPAEN